MYYKLVLILNDYKFVKTINFLKNICITKIGPYNNISEIMFYSKKNIIKIELYEDDKKIFDSDIITIPKKLYKLYEFNFKKLYTHCIEFSEYLICIDIMKIYKMKYFKSIFILKKCK